MVQPNMSTSMDQIYYEKDHNTFERKITVNSLNFNFCTDRATNSHTLQLMRTKLQTFFSNITHNFISLTHVSNNYLKYL